MINTKQLTDLSRFLSIKQVCDASNVNYVNVAQKVVRFRKGHKAKLTRKEALRITKQLKVLARKFQEL